VIRARVSAVAAALLLGAAACSDSPTTPTAPSAPTIVGLTISPSTLTIARHQTTSVTATVQRSDGSKEDVSAKATWTSSSPETVAVQSGLAVGVNLGAARVTAGYGGYVASIDATVRRNLVVTLSIDVRYGGAGRVIGSLDGREFDRCEGVVSSNDCELSMGYSEVRPSIDPGTHELKVIFEPMAPLASGTTMSTGYSYGYVNDGDTDSTLKWLEFSRQSTDVVNGSRTLTWTFDVPVYR
jgi:hypothetical protein